jgi:intracellular sulfur oxidation DsrE/DsrF family protein
MKCNFLNTWCLAVCFTAAIASYGQHTKATTGPVFDNIGPVYTVTHLDHKPDTSKQLKAIFDVDRKQSDPSQLNTIISSLHRYYNLHVRYGFPKEQIHLAVILHGGATKDALSAAAYQDKYKVENPNIELIKSLSEMGVEIFLCGQSMSHSGYSKADLLPEVKVALSAMTVLTVYQMDDYALIKF